MTCPTILVDTREQTPLCFSDAVKVERATLATGDYSIAGCTDRVAIERKSLADLVACCGRDRERFLDCCRRLRDFQLGLIVVEATTLDVAAKLYRSRMRPASVIGTMLAIHVDYGVPTLWAGNADDAAKMVERILLRVWRKRVAESEAAA